MKKILLLSVILISLNCFSQNVAINTSGTTAHASAMLDVSSNSKGILVPRMTSSERQAIQNPANGLLVYDVNTNGFWYYSSVWKELTNSNNGGGGFTLPYSGTASSSAKLFSVLNNSITAGSAGVYGRASASGSSIFTGYSMGVWGDNSSGVGVMGSSNNIGILGTSGNATEGIGVMGTSSSTGLYRGAVSGINNVGIGVYGQSNGADGAGVSGVGGSNGSNSLAASFRNINSSNTRAAVEITNNGSSNNSLYIHAGNATATGAILRMMNLGNGNFMQLQDAALTNITTISKNGHITTKGNMSSQGNIYTQGDLYVNGLKGIVRNTYSNQVRMEPMTITIPGKFFPGGEFISSQTVSYTFNTPYSTPPAVMLANTLVFGGATHMETYVHDVTTTGFKVTRSGFSFDYTTTNSVHRVIVMGSE